MRTPIRSELEAFRLTLAGAVLLGASLLIGWLIEPLAGVVVFVILVAVAVVAYLRAPNPDRPTVLRDAARAPHPPRAVDEARHVLVIANETLSGDDLHERIAGSGAERVMVDVLAPLLTSHAHAAVSDIDRERAEARVRLERSLAWAREHGIRARGEIGDPSPSTAMADELRRFGADEVIVVTHSRERQSWQERGELKRLRSELDVPVVQVIIDERAGS
ncbi:MAG: hypothetical protein ACXVHB_24310 [Solirubrobacteraceae bacterium]